jgi:hypothetical protein
MAQHYRLIQRAIGLQTTAFDLAILMRYQTTNGRAFQAAFKELTIGGSNRRSDPPVFEKMPRPVTLFSRS